MGIVEVALTVAFFVMAFSSHFYLLLQASGGYEKPIALTILFVSLIGIMGLLQTDIGESICHAISATSQAEERE